jgi:enoyl-CoA hydratase/carnithine racemase
LGFGLIMRSDIAIAAANTRFALDEVKLGIPPMFIMEQILEHLPAKRALDFILTGREFGADEALQIGLVSRARRGNSSQRCARATAASCSPASAICARLAKCRPRPARLTRSWNRRNLPWATLSSAES